MKHLMIAVAAAVLVTTVANTQAFEKKKEVEPTCPVSGKAIDKTKIVSHNGGDIFFCCGGCPGAFKKDTAKFAAKANLQLVQTGQAKQKSCPFTGGKVNATKTVAVGGVDVGLCCGNCLKKAKGAEGDKQLALLFNDKTFLKGFEVKKD